MKSNILINVTIKVFIISSIYVVGSFSILDAMQATQGKEDSLSVAIYNSINHTFELKIGSNLSEKIKPLFKVSAGSFANPSEAVADVAYFKHSEKILSITIASPTLKNSLRLFFKHLSPKKLRVQLFYYSEIIKKLTILGEAEVSLYDIIDSEKRIAYETIQAAIEIKSEALTDSTLQVFPILADEESAVDVQPEEAVFEED